MSGRKDYNERKQMKKEKYQELADKSKANSKVYSEISDRIAYITNGQPILVDHYSAKKHIRDLKKMNRATDKAIEESEKSDYYENKIRNIENNTTISSDDPDAIQKLEEKLKALEKCKDSIKEREHKGWELSNINQQMRATRERIKELKELEEIQFEDIKFNGGKVINNKDINRIQIIFDSVPAEEIRDVLKHRGFKWSRSEKAWQRLYNKNGITATKLILEAIEKLQDNSK